MFELNVPRWYPKHSRVEVPEIISAEQRSFRVLTFFQRWFYTWKFSFSALFRAESALFKIFQVMNSAQTNLRLFWIRADQGWMSLRRQPGLSWQLILTILKILRSRLGSQFWNSKKSPETTAFRVLSYVIQDRFFHSFFFFHSSWWLLKYSSFRIKILLPNQLSFRIGFLQFLILSASCIVRLLIDSQPIPFRCFDINLCKCNNSSQAMNSQCLQHCLFCLK